MNEKSASIIKRVKGSWGRIYCAVSVAILVLLVATVFMESFYSSLYFREECVILFAALIPAFLQVLAVSLTQVQKERAGNGLAVSLQTIKLIAALLIMSAAIFLCILSINKTSDEYYDLAGKYIPDIFSINVRDVSVNSIVVSFAVLAVGSFFAALHAIFYLRFLAVVRNVYKNKYNGKGFRGMGRVSVVIAVIQTGVYLSQLLDYPRYSGKAFEGLSTFTLFDWFVAAINILIVLSMLTLAVIAFRADSAVKSVIASAREQDHNANSLRNNVDRSDHGQGGTTGTAQKPPAPENPYTQPHMESAYGQYEAYPSGGYRNGPPAASQPERTDTPDPYAAGYNVDTHMPAHTVAWDDDLDDEDLFFDLDDDFDAVVYLPPEEPPRTDIRDRAPEPVPYYPGRHDPVKTGYAKIYHESGHYIPKRDSTCIDYGYSENEII